jgi:glycosyltransferase involved in cell wall biosynthesis
MTIEAPKKIKVCFVAPKAYPIFNPDRGNYFGGAEVDLYYLATEFAHDSNFEVSFIVADYGQNDIEVIEGVTVLKALDFRRNVLNGLLRTWSALKRADADIYVLKCASPGVPLVAAFCKLHRRIFLYRLASLLESDGTYARQHPILGRLFAWSLRQAAIVFAQNATDAENLTRTVGISSRVIPNGHRLQQVQQQTRDTILWVGRDDPIKNPERFLDLARAVPNEHFTMVCQTLNNDQHYANLITEASKIPNLQFIRHVPFNQIDAYFQRAKVFVNTSEAEGFPNTFIQACKCGTAILSFAVNPDGFLDAHACGLCCNGDSSRLTYNLRFMLENNCYVGYGSNGRRYAERYHDITKIAAEYKSVFARLVRDR